MSHMAPRNCFPIQGEIMDTEPAKPVRPRLEVIDDDPSIAPRRAHYGDAGLDIALREDVMIYPGETEYVPSNVRFYLPDGWAVLVMPRTSSFKHRVNILTTVIDSSYTGEASTIVTNNNTYPVQVKRGTRLAQAVAMPYVTFENEPLPQNANGVRTGKFGSSDIE